jgi:hypothetical protein
MDNRLKKDILSVIAIIVVLSIFLGITTLIVHIEDAHLRKEGIISKGVITYCANKQTIHIACSFRASNGIVYNGKRSVNKKYTIGDTVYIIYLENTPEKHKIIDKYNEHDQKFLQDIQIRIETWRKINKLRVL